MYIAGEKTAVDTGDTYFAEIAKLPVSGAEVGRRTLVEHANIAKLEKQGGKPLEARADYARWIVDCPNCNNAEFAFEDNLFFCSLCHNSHVGSKVLKVKIPNERKKIEDLLGKRPINNRHWSPKDTIEELENDNMSHGLGVK